MNETLIYHSKLGFEPEEQRTPVLLLQGLGRTTDHWLGFDKMLAKQYPVIIVENRGVGRSSQKLPLNWTLNRMATDVHDVLKHLGIKEVHIMGLSLGGMTAIQYSLMFEQFVKSLCIVNSSVGVVKNRLTASGAKCFAKVAVDPKNAEKYLSRLLISPRNSDKTRSERVSSWEEIREQYGFDNSVVIKQLIAASRFGSAKRLKKIKCPTLVVYGEDDLLVPKSGSVSIHKNIPKSKFAVIEGGGHEITLDKPQQLIKKLTTFIRDQEK